MTDRRPRRRSEIPSSKFQTPRNIRNPKSKKSAANEVQAFGSDFEIVILELPWNLGFGVSEPDFNVIQ